MCRIAFYAFRHMCIFAHACLCMSVCTYTYIEYVYVCKYACIYVRVHVCMYVRMHACLHACLHVCMYAGMFACTYVRLHVCMHACLSACMHVRMYTPISGSTFTAQNQGTIDQQRDMNKFCKHKLHTTSLKRTLCKKQLR